MDNTRKYALNIIQRVLYEDAYATILMRKLPQDVDARFLTNLVFTTLRNIYALDYQYKNLINKSVKPKTRCILLLGLAQLFLMDDVPDYASIHATVELANSHEKAFVNAIFRQCLRQGYQQSDALDITYSHPLWLIQMWQKQYSPVIASKILQANQQPSKVYGRLNILKSTKSELESLGFQFIDDVSFTGEHLLTNPAFQEGKYVIQDIHAVEVVRMLDVKKGMHVLDACASPGTKSQLIAMWMENEGKLVAMELYPQRAKLIDQMMEKTGVTICQSLVGDSTQERKFDSCFDRILLDVPCSGLGDLRHKPEIRYHIQPMNLDDIISIQQKILHTNAKYLKVNGVMVYSTCTLNKKENEKMIRWFLQNHPNYKLLQEKTYFPFENHGDGFYYAKLQRIS